MHMKESSAKHMWGTNQRSPWDTAPFSSRPRAWLQSPPTGVPPSLRPPPQAHSSGSGLFSPLLFKKEDRFTTTAQKANNIQSSTTCFCHSVLRFGHSSTLLRTASCGPPIPCSYLTIYPLTFPSMDIWTTSTFLPSWVRLKSGLCVSGHTCAELFQSMFLRVERLRSLTGCTKVLCRS